MRDPTLRALEAILLVAEEPVSPGQLAEILELPEAQVDQLCKELAAGLEVDERGFVLSRVAGGYRFQTHPDMAAYVERFVLEGQSARLSAAALETLAIVAYKQPISRAQVAAIRGVNVEAVMRTLEQRGYIAEVGRDPGPGQAVLFGTTGYFLERLGLDSLDQLPSLSDFVPAAEVVEALESGLRPSGENLPRPPRGQAELQATATTQNEIDEAVDPATPEPGVGAMDSRRDDDAIARLDESTARLESLVDEVRDRLSAAEEAMRVADPHLEAADGESAEAGVDQWAGGDGGRDPDDPERADADAGDS